MRRLTTRIIILMLVSVLLVPAVGCDVGQELYDSIVQSSENNPLPAEYTHLELETGEEILSDTGSNQFSQHNPAYAEVIEFLANDKTDSRDYVKGEYVCSHFAADVNNAAESQGIRCALVLLRFPEQSHALIGFDTVDKGMVYFEAQTDERVRPEIGKKFWKTIEPKPGIYYEPPPYDDTILDIIIIW